MFLTKLLYILLIWRAATAASPNDSSTDTSLFENRVLGGFKCSTEEFPFMVLLMKQDKNKEWQRKCGGSLVDSRWVLTAAHCLDMKNPKGYLIVAAMNDPTGERVSEKSIDLFPHPEYNPDNLFNDIGLIKLADHIEKSTYVSYISLPGKPYTREYMENFCRNALVMGWGYTSNEKELPDLSDLQCAFLPMLASKQCKKMYFGFQVFDENICTLSTKGKDACQGDSGGPLLCGSLQTGIVSWGLECGVPTNPGIYTRVDQYGKFIQDTMAHMGRSRLCYTNTIYYLLIFLNFVTYFFI